MSQTTAGSKVYTHMAGARAPRLVTPPRFHAPVVVRFVPVAVPVAVPIIVPIRRGFVLTRRWVAGLIAGTLLALALLVLGGMYLFHFGGQAAIHNLLVRETTRGAVQAMRAQRTGAYAEAERAANEVEKALLEQGTDEVSALTHAITADTTGQAAQTIGR